MTDEETIQKLIELKLTTMAQAFRDLLAEPPGNQRSFTEKIGAMVDREWTDRDNRRLERLLRAARLSTSVFPSLALAKANRTAERATANQSTSP